MNLTDSQVEEIKALRHSLHEHAELSGVEFETVKILKSFLSEHTSLEIADLDGGFYAAHREAGASLPSVALRADFDALPTYDGHVAHLCGHDGHAASLCGVALAIEGKTLGRNVFLLFQGAEETGAGAQKCLELFGKEHIDEIYGIHNIPAVELGKVVTTPSTFACASCGVTLKLHGRATHAAYPELGVNPAEAVGRILDYVTDKYSREKDHTCFCTVIGTQLGEKAFGMSASEAELWLTLRAETDEPLDTMKKDILSFAEAVAGKCGLGFEDDTQDVFPATVNDPDCAEKVLDKCKGELMIEPMRWSEDFGHYLKKCRGAFLGVGAGVNHAPLHSKNYEYPDELLQISCKIFLNILANMHKI